MQIKTFLAAALVALLGACGGGDDDASPTNAPVSASRQQAVLRAAPVVLRVQPRGFCQFSPAILPVQPRDLASSAP